MGTYKRGKRNQTIKYATYQKLKDKENETILVKEIDTLESKLHNGRSDSDEMSTEIKRKKQELENIYDKRINRAILRSKAINIEGNEKKKNSKYFASLEKKTAEGKTIFKLKIEGNEIIDSKRILKGRNFL